MFWNRRKDEDPDHDGTHKLPPDPSGQTLRRRKLTPELQKLVDREEELLDQLYDGYSTDTTDTPYRYAGYATRIRTLLQSAYRYVAYTSDIGESFRPVAHPWLIRTAYGVSWAYILGDVGNEGYKAYLRNRRVLAPPSEAYWDATLIPIDGVTGKGAQSTTKQTLKSPVGTPSEAHPLSWPDPDEDTLVPWSTTKIPLSEDYRSVMAERAVFQILASMALPAFTIHSVVKYSGRALKKARSSLVRTWGPIGLGLSIVPLLPYIFDKPVEHSVQWTFHRAFLTIGGPGAVSRMDPDNSASSKTLRLLQNLQEQKRENEKPEIQAKGDRAKREKNS